ncbi:unnamed protein product [Calypogeia fissa]
MDAPKKDPAKWGTTVTDVIPATIDKVWAVLADFDGLQRHFPKMVATCDTVEGQPNKVGSLRLAKGVMPGGQVVEARERLLTYDEVNHTTSYAIEKFNHGWTGFVAHIKVESVEKGQTLVKWSFELDPVTNITEEEFLQRHSVLYTTALRLLKRRVAKCRSRM